MRFDHRPVETRYFAKKPGKENRQSMKNVDWAKFREDIGERMKGWEIPRTMTRNQLDEEVAKWHSIVREVVGKHSKIVLVRPRDPIVNQWYTMARCGRNEAGHGGVSGGCDGLGVP